MPGSTSISSEVLGYIIGVLIPVAGLYLNNKSKITEQEHRMTMIEAGQNYIQKLSEQNSRRLDEHDEQNKITYQLVEQIKAMKEDLIEIKQKLK
ncbi:hypothetical protein [Abiotrophia defectiva]|jgi:hypothetical protein|uniref:DUF7365 family protein n=1 Tax=Abiotrophia defectiva TaxID=46125 RepID=UPI002066303E|nr:hypothetical protein [Abiotrophia defectiva]DAY44889.1 MAG TPA: Dynamin-like helical domain [Caudoviricetes sp.]